jgi:hypothetical protein
MPIFLCISGIGNDPQLAGSLDKFVIGFMPQLNHSESMAARPLTESTRYEGKREKIAGSSLATPTISPVPRLVPIRDSMILHV